jgi:hypothetical protein
MFEFYFSAFCNVRSLWSSVISFRERKAGEIRNAEICICFMFVVRTAES